MASKEALSSMGSPEMKADMFSSGTTNQPPGLAEATADSEGVEAGAAPASEVSAIKGIRFIMVLFAVYSTSMLYGLDTTIVADVQGTVVEAFGDIEKLSWIGSGFPLGSIAIILTVGKAYGFFNMKWLYIFSVTVFEIGSVVCGAAPNMDALIIGRVVAGAGGAGIYLGGLNILSAVTTETERSLYMAGQGVVWGVGTILGPVIGGAFSDSSATWRWSFYINLVIAALCVPVYFWALPSMDPQPGAKTIAKFKQIDWAGTFLNAGIYLTWVMGLTFGGRQWPWNDGRTIAVFVLCGVFIIVFGLQQRFLVFTSFNQRIFPAGFLLSRTFLLQYLNVACLAATLFVPVYYIPIFFQFTRGDSALDAAVRLLPFITVAITAMMINGALLPKFGYYAPWSIASGVLVTVGGSLMYTVTASTSPSAVYGYSVLIALGTGLSTQQAYSILTVKVVADPRFGPHMIPDTIGFLNMAQIGSIVHALAISGTVYQNLAYQYLSEFLARFDFTDAQLENAAAGAESDFFLHATDEVKELAIDALVKAIARIYILVIAAGAVTFLAGLAMKRERLFV